ncbi:hypothetical protein FVE85_6091 [Porphyridium purpureum]|uniref:Uncharacterized protein n=1 Tax=Porphyridium purpureum TaxID=35688 RepID=A0A5J4Z4D7_PORPP|nr:hypothetical protein FVE85_6091 [Porphyridium purpureum]|eukprot:POR3249..scf295_1
MAAARRVGDGQGNHGMPGVQQHGAPIAVAAPEQQQHQQQQQQQQRYGGGYVRSSSGNMGAGGQPVSQPLGLLKRESTVPLLQAILVFSLMVLPFLIGTQSVFHETADRNAVVVEHSAHRSSVSPATHDDEMYMMQAREILRNLSMGGLGVSSIAGVQDADLEQDGWTQLEMSNIEQQTFSMAHILKRRSASAESEQQQAPVPKTALVAACGDQVAHLSLAMASWLQVKELDEIVVVDWSLSGSSGNMVRRYADKPNGKIVRSVWVPQQVFVRSWAYNLALRLASASNILAVDCNVILDPNFLEGHKLETVSSTFYSGEVGSKLSHVLFIARNLLENVAGYDERMVSAGYLDVNMRRRIEQNGGIFSNVNEQLIHVIPFEHPKVSILSRYVEGTDATARSNESSSSASDVMANAMGDPSDPFFPLMQKTDFQIALNRRSSSGAPAWMTQPGETFTEFKFFVPSRKSRLSDADLIAKPVKRAKSLHDSLTTEQWDKLKRLALQDVLQHNLKIPLTLVERFFSDSEVTLDRVRNYTFEERMHPPRLLIGIVQGKDVATCMSSLAILLGAAEMNGRLAVITWAPEAAAIVKPLVGLLDFEAAKKRLSVFARKKTYMAVMEGLSCKSSHAGGFGECVADPDSEWHDDFEYFETNGDMSSISFAQEKNVIIKLPVEIKEMRRIDLIPSGEFQQYAALWPHEDIHTKLKTVMTPGPGCLVLNKMDATDGEIASALDAFVAYRRKIAIQDSVEVPFYRVFAFRREHYDKAAASFKNIATGEETLSIIEPGVLVDNDVWNSVYHQYSWLFGFHYCRGYSFMGLEHALATNVLKYVLMWRKLNAPELVTDMLRNLGSSGPIVNYEFRNW